MRLPDARSSTQDMVSTGVPVAATHCVEVDEFEDAVAGAIVLALWTSLTRKADVTASSWDSDNLTVLSSVLFWITMNAAAMTANTNPEIAIAMTSSSKVKAASPRGRVTCASKSVSSHWPGSFATRSV